MRKKNVRQMPLDFAGTQKLTKDWYALYYRIHKILKANPEIVELVHVELTQGLEKLKRNVEGLASESIMRLIIVQQIERLSFREVIVRVDDSEMLRYFCRIYDDAIISHSRYATLVSMIQPSTWKKINEIIVKFARDKKGFKGKSLRLDTTAVETNVHFPMDSTLLCDSVRVLSRLLRHIGRIDRGVLCKWRGRERDAKRLTQKLLRGGAKLHKAKRKKWYSQLIASTERVMVRAAEVQQRINEGQVTERNPQKSEKLESYAQEIAEYMPLVARCVAQGRKRVLEEQEVPNEEKIFSIFEPHTELLIRGKAGKKIEFGHMVEVRQVENGLITHYQTHEKRPAEPALLIKAVLEHKEVFGRVPERCAGDKGFYSAEAVARVASQGVEEVCVPKKGRRNEEEEKREHSRWFKQAQAFRAGIEGTISALKRSFGLRRCLRKGWDHFQSLVGTGVLAHNLTLLAET